MPRAVVSPASVTAAMRCYRKRERPAQAALAACDGLRSDLVLEERPRLVNLRRLIVLRRIRRPHKSPEQATPIIISRRGRLAGRTPEHSCRKMDSNNRFGLRRPRRTTRTPHTRTTREGSFSSKLSCGSVSCKLCSPMDKTPMSNMGRRRSTRLQSVRLSPPESGKGLVQGSQPTHVSRQGWDVLPRNATPFWDVEKKQHRDSCSCIVIG